MIYFPMTCNILTKGHIEALKMLVQEDFVRVGLLTAKALEGYKKELVPFEDREYILKAVIRGFDEWEDIQVVPQESLDPSANIKAYRCTAIASGDGWAAPELKAIEKFGLRKIEFDSGCTIHSSDIIKKAA